MQYPSGQVPESRPGCCVCRFITLLDLASPGMLLLPVRGRFPQDTMAFRLLCEWPCFRRGWHLEPPALARRSLHLYSVTYHSSKGARRLLLCAISSLNLPGQPLLSEENDLSWREEHSRDFLEQSAEPALEERLTKNPGSSSLTLMPSCLLNDLDTIKLMET